MAEFATASAVVGVLANAFTLGKELVTLYQSLTEARTEITERIAYVRNHWVRTKVQLEIIERTWPTLDEDHQAVYHETLTVLVTKLKASKEKLHTLLRKKSSSDQVGDGRPAVRRWKYLFLRTHLDDTIKSLDKWSQMHDPTWFLIIRIASPIVDSELSRLDTDQTGEARIVLKTATQIRRMLTGQPRSKHLFLPSSGPQDSSSSSVPYSSAIYQERKNKNGLLIDSIQCTPCSYVGDMDQQIRALATKLQCADPSTFGVLNCKGVVKNKTSNGSRVKSFDVVFQTPTPDRPRTLRNCLVHCTPHTLTERVDLARQLARSITYVHTLDFVHKNIRPENMVGFGDSKLGTFYLIGFEQVRSADGDTFLQGDTDWHKNLYRHPDRQGLHPQERYCMQHDIYSLGVCLLEIGLWDSFVIYSDDGKVKAPNAPLLGLSVEQLAERTPSAIKKVLVGLAMRELPSRVGNLYMEVVVNCLTCLDEENDFGDESEFEDESGVAVGVRYIDKVCSNWVEEMDRRNETC